jgi:hypothetical protein
MESLTYTIESNIKEIKLSKMYQDRRSDFEGVLTDDEYWGEVSQALETYCTEVLDQPCIFDIAQYEAYVADTENNN